MAYCELTTLDKEFLRSLIDNQTGKICDSIRALRVTIEEQLRTFGGSTYNNDCMNKKLTQESCVAHNIVVNQDAKGIMKRTIKLYNRERDTYIEFDVCDTLKDFVNNVKNLYNISCIRVKLYDINDVLKHYSEIKEKRCHNYILNYDLKDGDEEDSRPFIANTGINVYDHETWKYFENLMVVKTAKLVNRASANKTVYEINTGLSWVSRDKVVLQIFIFSDTEAISNDE